MEKPDKGSIAKGYLEVSEKSVGLRMVKGQEVLSVLAIIGKNWIMKCSCLPYYSKFRALNNWRQYIEANFRGN
jgi:hypothetical protein